MLLQTASAFLTNDDPQEIQARVVFDTGSQISYIRKNIAESLNLKGPVETLSISTLGGETIKSKKMQRVKVNIKGS